MQNLDQEIQKKINGWKRTRYNRINISERLKKYDSYWNTIIFFMNVFAIGLTIISLKFPLKTGIDTVFAGCFSMYVILLQYFLANQNYKTRSLKFHYEQLEIEKLRFALKKLLRNSSLSCQEKQEEYTSISNQYLISLKNNENHDKIDDKFLKNENSRCDEENKKNVFDTSLDKMFIWLNLLIFLGVVIFAITIYL